MCLCDFCCPGARTALILATSCSQGIHQDLFLSRIECRQLVPQLWTEQNWARFITEIAAVLSLMSSCLVDPAFTSACRCCWVHLLGRMELWFTWDMLPCMWTCNPQLVLSGEVRNLQVEPCWRKSISRVRLWVVLASLYLLFSFHCLCVDETMTSQLHFPVFMPFPAHCWAFPTIRDLSVSLQL